MLAILSGIKEFPRPRDTKLYRLDFVDENGVIVNESATINLSGYVIPVSGGVLSNADTLLEAFGKLEARILALENAASSGYGA